MHQNEYNSPHWPPWMQPPAHYRNPQPEVKPEKLPWCFSVWCVRCDEFTTQEHRAVMEYGSVFLCREPFCRKYNYDATPKVIKCLESRHGLL